MSLSHVYLTIDDTPSKNTSLLVDDLINSQIPAVFYARGEFIHHHEAGLVDVIHKEFLVGNHSFSHPYFSKISLAKCIKEIETTEILIDRCYRLANKPRPAKVIRLPWSDRGAGADLALPTNSEDEDKYHGIQDYLLKQGFSKLHFKGFAGDAIDAPFSWKTNDFKERYVTDHQGFVANLENYYQQSKRSYEIMLAHDFDRNYDLMRLTLQFLKNKKIATLLPELSL